MHVRKPRFVLSCACGRQLSWPPCGDPACLDQHKERLGSDEKQTQCSWSQCGSILHSTARESISDSKHMPCPHYIDTSSHTDSSEDDAEFGLLGMLVGVVDDAASDFVYGPLGTPGRPGGVMDVSFLSSMANGRLLSADGHKRWMQFLSVWQNAGWSLQDLLQVTDQLRPLQYGSDLEMADLASVQAMQLDCCIAKYCDQAQDETPDRLLGFLAVVQNHFSQRNAVLVLADDAVKRFSMIPIP